MKQATLDKAIEQLNPVRSPYLCVIAALVMGSILRLIYPGDMEWKDDEIWNYEQGEALSRGQISFSWVGMHSSAGFPNPGFGLWVYGLLGMVSDTPIEMVRWVMGLNVAALWLMFAFVIWQIPEEERAPWLWGLAIVAVNPMAILFSRKLWTNDLFPPIAVLVILGNWFRHRVLGALTWGLLGTLIGQLQMSGFFYGAGLFLWTVWRDYKEKRLPRIAWKAWIIGTLIGLFPFVMWLRLVIHDFGKAGRTIVSLLVPKFYLHWIVLGLGTNLSYSINDYMWSDFIKEPLILGQPTYLMAIAHVILILIGLRVVISFIRRKTVVVPRSLDFYLKGVGLGMGGLLTLSMVNVPPHYMIVTFPFIHIWWASRLQNQPRSLLTLILIQLLISITFIAFIHRTGGIPDTNYGMTYWTHLEQKPALRS